MHFVYRYTTLVLLAVIPIVYGTGELYASGAKESRAKERISQAESLIEEGRYNDAIELISELMKSEPRYFDEAEKLMKKVRAARKEYNDTYQELIDILDLPPGEELNEEEAYAIIQKLEELDADPNKASIAAFAQARRSIIFAVNDRRFRSIMNEAETLLAQERYSAAIDRYLSGFSLHEELFLEDDYGEIVVNQAEGQKSEIRRRAGSIRERLPPLLQQSAELLRSAQSDSPQEMEAVYRAFAQQADALFSQWDGTVNTALQLDTLRESIQGDDRSDIPHLSVIRVLTKGRESGELPAGIAGAAERPAASGIAAAAAALDSRMLASFNTALASYDQGLFEESNSEFFLTDGYAGIYREILELWRGHTESHDRYDVPIKMGLTEDDLRRDDLFAQAVIAAAGEYGELITAGETVQRLRETGLAAEDINLIEESHRELEEVLERMRQNLTDNNQRRQIYREQEGTGIDLEEALAILSGLAERYEKRSREGTELRAGFVGRIAELRLDPQEETLVSAEKRFSRAQSYVKGIEQVVLEGGEAIEVKYPSQALSLISRLNEDIQEIERLVTEILQGLEEEPQVLRELEEPARQMVRSRDILARIEELRTEQGAVVQKAGELNREADIALAEGDLRFSEAESLMNRNNFERAREKLEQAGSAYATSLTFREDPAVREKMDEEIPALAERIVFLQNQQIVREVRDLINRGRELFFQEDFVQSERVLLRARSKWLITHTQEDPEISLWLNRVQRALETTAGVSISQTDPLFPDMMQVLNLAKKDYQEGRELFERGRRDKAMELFVEAEKKIEYIKEPFPNNREAGVLYLRILRYTEPQDFTAIFGRRFTDARQKTRTAPEEAYRELKVLEEINPDYPGMAQAIYDAEIATGIRRLPPDPAKLARAGELYEQARSIVEEDVRAQFPVALTYLNEAINLNPGFQDALLLKDRVQAGQGGQVRVVLSSFDQQKLREAENLFIDARYFEAGAIVDQLLQDPENRKNPRLLELKRRIESKL